MMFFDLMNPNLMFFYITWLFKPAEIIYLTCPIVFVTFINVIVTLEQNK